MLELFNFFVFSLSPDHYDESNVILTHPTGSAVIWPDKNLSQVISCLLGLGLYDYVNSSDNMSITTRE